MSRKGKAPIQIPKGVEVKVVDDAVTIKGAKGTLTRQFMPGIGARVEDGHLLVEVTSGKDSEMSRYHGLYRSLLHGMVVGVSVGFQRRLELVGVGYRAAVKGSHLELQVGYSHPVLLDVPAGISIAVEEKNTVVVLNGINKQALGQFAANIRGVRPPEPYKGKGIRYQGEYVRRKAGKSGK